MVYSSIHRDRKIRNFLNLWPVASALALCPATVHAQDAAPPSVGADAAVGEGDSDGAEIMVTATRRTESLHDVPVSATVLSEERLGAVLSGGGDYVSLAGKVPSLNVETSNGRSAPRFYIRGYGNTDFTAFASQPVSLILDGVVLEVAALKGFPVFDAANIEVLRGPQGTLFGRNTPAGIVNIRSAAPDLKATSGYASASIGTSMTSRVEAAVNLPLSDNLAIRVSNLYQHRDGYIWNPITNSHMDGYDDYAGRAQILFRPSDTFDMLLNGHVWRMNGGLTVYRANIIKPGTNELVDGFDPSVAYTDTPNHASTTNWGLSLQMNWDLGPVILRSITGYERGNNNGRGDFDGGYGAVYAPPYGPGFIPFFVNNDGNGKASQISQELRAESAGSSRLQYQAGVFLYRDTIEGTGIVYVNDSDIVDSSVRTQQKSASAAVFGSVNYKVTDALEIRGGLRLTYDEKKVATLETFNTNLAAPTSAETSTTKVNWDISGTYAISPDVSLYGRIANAYRAPSFGAAGQFQGLQIAKAETAMSYEAGIKTFLFDRRVRFDLSAFYYSVKDQQLNAVGGNSNASILLNAARTVGKGLEAEFDARITDNLRVSLSGSINDTELRDPNLKVLGCNAPCTILDPIDGNGFVSVDGNPLPQAAKYILNASVSYNLPISDTAELFFLGDVNYRSAINLVLYDTKEFVGQALTEVGLRGGVKLNDGKYEIFAFCRNCTNQVKIINALDFNNLTGSINQPRVVAVGGTVKF